MKIYESQDKFGLHYIVIVIISTLYEVMKCRYTGYTLYTVVK